MGKFELKDKNFHDYNNGGIRRDVLSRKGMLQDNPYRNYDTRSDLELLGYLSNYLVQKDSSQKPELSFLFKLLRFFRYFRWSNSYYKSGGGKISDYRFYAREIHYHLKKLTKLSYLSSHEIRQLLSSSLRIYYKDGWDEGTPLELIDLHRCKNLQEFYTEEDDINFEFAKDLKNLRVVDLYTNDADNKRGIRKGVKRNVTNLKYLNYCLVLNLQDSYVDDFSAIPDKILTLNVKNSNFQDLSTIINLKNLQYLDISDNEINSLKGVQFFKDLKVLNCCNIDYCGTESSKIDFFSQLNSLINLELLVMDSKLFDDYQKVKGMLPIEKIVVKSKGYMPSVKMSTYSIVYHFKIPEQLNNYVSITDIEFEPIKELFTKN